MPDSALDILKMVLLVMLYLFFARVLWAVWSEVRQPANVRQSTDAPFPAMVHDIKAAIRFLRARAAESENDSTVRRAYEGLIPAAVTGRGAAGGALPAAGGGGAGDPAVADAAIAFNGESLQRGNRGTRRGTRGRTE